MKKLFKRIFMSVLFLIGVSVLSIAGMIFIFDLKYFKPQIINLLQKSLGHTVEIEGEMQLYFMPEFKIRIGKIKIHNSPEFTNFEFTEWEYAEISVKPRLIRPSKITIGSIVVKRLILNLSINQQNHANWDDWISHRSEDKSSTLLENVNSLFAWVDFDTVHVEQSEINFINQRDDYTLKLSDLDFTVKGLGQGGKIPINWTATIQHTPSAFHQNLEFSAQLTLDGVEKSLHLEQFNFLAKDIPQVSLKANSIDYRAAPEYLAISNLEISSGPLSVQSTLASVLSEQGFVLQGHVSLSEFNPKQLMGYWLTDLPLLQDDSVLTHLAAELDLSISKERLQLAPIKLTLDDSSIEGVMELGASQQKLALELDQLNLDRYASANRAGSDQPLSGSTSETLLGALEQFIHTPIDGRLKVKKLIVNHVEMQDIVLDFR